MAIRGGRRSSHARVLLLLLGGFLAPASAVAQQVATVFQFSFSNPGARSLALGGSFAALADDATAAFANPAGLTQLTRPEVSLEGRAWSYSTPFTRGGRAAGPPTGLGIDVTPNVVTGRSSAELESLSFVSCVVPLGRWTLAVYRHQLANFESSFEVQSIFIDYPDGSVGTLLPQRGGLDTEIVGHGVSVGLEVMETLSLGLGLTYFESDITAADEIYFPDGSPTPDFEAPIDYGPASFLPERRVGTFSLEAHSADVGLTAGMLWRLPAGWKLGAFYRHGPNVKGEFEFTTGPFSQVPQGTVLTQGQGERKIPDVYGLGVSRRFVGDRLTLGFEWDRVEYSVLGDDDQGVDDGDEIHLGAEYVLIGASPILAVRAGAWLDPDHSLQQTDDNLLLDAFYPPGSDEIHFAAGLGLTFERVQIDLGVDLSDLSDTVAISTIYSF